MLRESFVLLPRIGRVTERCLWRQGITDWNSYIAAPRVKGVSSETKERHDLLLSTARQKLIDGDSSFFGPLLHSTEHWRLYPEFKDEALFLDIETGERGEVTVVGLATPYGECHTLLRGSNLTRQNIQKLLAPAKLLVTFNGRSFDVPVIEKYFGMRIDTPHVDLMHACRRIGLTGGLKHIERELGIRRPDELAVVNGAQAPELWRCWRATGDEHFLKLLMSYNEEDCVNLKRIADKIIPELWERSRYN